MTNLNAIIVLLVFACSVHIAFAEPVVWTDMRGVEVENDKITKNISRYDWSSFAYATTFITNGTGIVEFSVPQNDKWVALRFKGVFNNDVYDGQPTITFENAVYRVMVENRVIATHRYSTGDVFKVEFDFDDFKIFQNNKHIVTKAISFPDKLFVSFRPFTPFAAISDVTIDNLRESVLNPSLKKSLSSMNDIFGDLFGMPIVFLFLVFIASIFTPKNAHIGILILGFLIAIMIAFELITISAEVFGLIIVIIALGLFVGRKKS